MAGLLERLGWLKASSNLRAAFQRAEEVAAVEAGHQHAEESTGHVRIEPDHLLAGLLDDPEAAVVLETSGYSRRKIFETLSWERRGTTGLKFSACEDAKSSGALVPSVEVRQLIAHACELAESEKKKIIEGSDLVRAFFERPHLLKNASLLAKPCSGRQKLLPKPVNKRETVRRAVAKQDRQPDQDTKKTKTQPAARDKESLKKESQIPKGDFKEPERPERSATFEQKKSSKFEEKHKEVNGLLSPSVAAFTRTDQTERKTDRKRDSRPGKIKEATLPPRWKTPRLRSEAVQGRKKSALYYQLPARPKEALKSKEASTKTVLSSKRAGKSIPEREKSKTGKGQQTGLEADSGKKEKAGTAAFSKQNPGQDTVSVKKAGQQRKKVELKREERKAVVNRTYFDDGLPENTQIHESVETLLAARKKAEMALADCEWYDLLLSLGRVSDDLESEDQIHRLELIDKAYEEIDKVPRWRKAIAFIQYLDTELSKLHLGEHFEPRPEFAMRRTEESETVKENGAEDSGEASGEFLDVRLHSIESHMRELEKMLQRQHKKRKRKKSKAVKAEKSEPVLPPVQTAALPNRALVDLQMYGRDEDQQMIRSLQEQIARLDEQNRVLNQSKQQLEDKIHEFDEKQRGLLVRSKQVFQDQAEKERLYQDEIAQIEDLRAQLSRLDGQNQRLLLEKSDAERRIRQLSGQCQDLSRVQARIDEIDRKNEDLQRDKRALEAKIAELSKVNRDYSHLQTQKNWLEEENRRLQEEKAEAEKRIHQLSRQSQDTAELRTRMTELDRKNENLEHRRQELEKKLVELSGRSRDYSHLLAQKIWLEEQNQRLQREKSDAESRIRQLGSQNRDYMQQRTRISELDRKNEELQRGRRELEARLQEYEKKVAELSSRSRDASHLQAQKAWLEEQNRILQKTRKELEDKIAELDGQRRSLSIRTSHLESERDLFRRDKEKVLLEKRALQTRVKETDSRTLLLKEKARSRKKQLLALGEHGYKSSREVARLEAANARLLEDIEVLTAELRSRDGDIQAMNRRMENLRQELDKARHEVRDMFHMRTERNRLKTEVEELNKRLVEQEALREKISSIHGKLSDEVSLAGSLAEQQEKFLFLKQENRRVSDKAVRRKAYIQELEQKVQKLESEVRFIQARTGDYEQTAEQAALLGRQVNEKEAKLSEKDARLHDYQEYIKALEKDIELSKQDNGEQATYIAALEEKLRSHEEYSGSKDASLKRYQEEVREKDEELLNIRGKLNLEKEKSVTRERHVRALEQHAKTLQSQIDELKSQVNSLEAAASTAAVAASLTTTKAVDEGDDLVEVVGHDIGYYTVASPAVTRYDDTDGLVEIIREV